MRSARRRWYPHRSQRQRPPPQHKLRVRLAKLDGDHRPADGRRRIRRENDVGHRSSQHLVQRVNGGTPRHPRSPDEAADDHDADGQSPCGSRARRQAKRRPRKYAAANGKQPHRLERNSAYPRRGGKQQRHGDRDGESCGTAPAIPCGRNPEEQPQPRFQDEDGVSEVPLVVDRIKRMDAVAVEGVEREVARKGDGDEQPEPEPARKAHLANRRKEPVRQKQRDR